MSTFLPRFAVCLLAALALVAHAQQPPEGPKRTPLPKGHPLLGAWRIDVPGTDCHEIYIFRADGTMSVTSGAQAAETEFEVDAEPSAKGFYRWSERILKDNGKPDCMGETLTVGMTATNFVYFDGAAKVFLLCRGESLDGCIGPFERQGRDT